MCGHSLCNSDDGDQGCGGYEAWTCKWYLPVRIPVLFFVCQKKENYNSKACDSAPGHLIGGR